jgi:predicted kinase
VYVLVNGLPGSGKTTVAAPLATRLGLALLARDSIKEALWDALGPGDLAWARRLGAASADVFWLLAREARAAVLDNNIHGAFAYRLEALAPPIVEVHCSCPAELARERYLSRRRHPCHFDNTYGAEMFDQWIRDTGPVLKAPYVLDLDTTDHVDLDNVAAWVRATSGTQ